MMTYQKYEKAIDLIHLIQILDQLLYHLIQPSWNNQKGLKEDGDPTSLQDTAKLWRLSINSILLFMVLVLACGQHNSVCLRIHQGPQLLSSFIVFILQISGLQWLCLFNWNKLINGKPEVEHLEQVIFILCNILSFTFSIWISHYFGDCYRQLKLTGKYPVGHRTFYAEKFGNWVSVYYPASSKSAKNSSFYQLKPHLDYKDSEPLLISQEACIFWLFK